MPGKYKIMKIQDTRGASLAIALVYFLICATVGSVVLAAAMANISHVKTEKTNEGSYLAVMSAGQTLKAQLEGAAVEWTLNHGEQDEQAAEDEKAGFKAALLLEEDSRTEVSRAGGGHGMGDRSTASQTSAALSEAMYKVYLNCVEEDSNRLKVPKEERDKEDRAESLTLAFRLESSGEAEEDMQAVTADLKFTPDYVVMDSGDSQQLQVKIEADLRIDPDEEGKGQYFLRMTANGVVHYTLEEIVTEVEESGGSGGGTGGDGGTGGEAGDGDDDEPEYVYSYESRAVMSSDRPVFSGGQDMNSEQNGTGGELYEEAEE